MDSSLLFAHPMRETVTALVSPVAFRTCITVGLVIFGREDRPASQYQHRIGFQQNDAPLGLTSSRLSPSFTSISYSPTLETSRRSGHRHPSRGMWLIAACFLTEADLSSFSLVQTRKIEISSFMSHGPRFLSFSQKL